MDVFATEIFNSIADLLKIEELEKDPFSIIESCLAIFASKFECKYLLFSFSPSVGRPIELSYGVQPTRLGLINDFVIDNPDLFDIFSVKDNQVLSFNKTRAHRSLLRIKTILSLHAAQTAFESKFILYYHQNHADISFDGEKVDFLKSTLLVLSNALSSVIRNVEVRKRQASFQQLFEHAPEAMMLVDYSLRIIRHNQMANHLLISNVPEYMPHKMKQYITSPGDRKNLDQLIIDPELKRNAMKLVVDWKIEENLPIKITLSISSYSDTQGGQYFIIIAHHETDAYLRTPDDLVPVLSEYLDLLTTDDSKATDFATEKLFPASFAFSLNEHSGPLPVAVSPDIDIYEIFEATIGLFASIDTMQIIERQYISGTTPWNNPVGDIHWIAFSRENPDARGGVDIHMIGIVLHSNLLHAYPSIVQPLLGTLLSGMNNFISLLHELKIDYTTVNYALGSDLPNVTHVRTMLEDLRKLAADVMGAYLSVDYHS